MSASKLGFGLLSDGNYAVWRARMSGLLASKGLGEALVKAGTESDAAAKGYLMPGVSDQYLPVVEAAKSAKETWEGLQAIYKQSTTAGYIRLRREFNKLDMANFYHVKDYIAEARNLALQLKAIDHEPSQEHIVAVVLAGLKPEFAAIRVVLENMAELPSLEEVQAKLMIEEGKIYGNGARETALAALGRRKQQGKSERFCWACDQPGHIKRNCPNKGKDEVTLQAITM